MKANVEIIQFFIVNLKTIETDDEKDISKKIDELNYFFSDEFYNLKDYIFLDREKFFSSSWLKKEMLSFYQIKKFTTSDRFTLLLNNLLTKPIDDPKNLKEEFEQIAYQIAKPAIDAIDQESDLEIEKFTDILEEVDKSSIPIIFYSLLSKYSEVKHINNITYENFNEGKNKFEEYYIKNYLDRCKIFWKSVQSKFPRQLDRFDNKDESLFPHIHFKKDDSAIYLIDLYFTDKKIWKHIHGKNVNDPCNKYICKDLQNDIQKNRFKLQ